MTAPDKPLYERIAERLASDWCRSWSQQIEEDEALLREAAEALRKAELAKPAD